MNVFVPTSNAPPEAKAFAQELRAYLVRTGETQSKLGQRLGRSRVTVARWLACKHVPDELTRIGALAALGNH